VRQPSAPLLLIAAVALLAAALALVPFESHDLWWHLRAGELILESGRVPAHNTFSFTAPSFPWITHEWLAELLFFWVFDRLGPAALVALKALLVGLTFGVVCWTAWRESGNAWVAGAVTVIAAQAARFVFDIRPHLFTLLGLALLLAVLSHDRRRGGRLCYALVPLFLVWANLHSGFIVGLGGLALATALTAARRRALWPVLLLSTLACLLTPNHWRGLWFPLMVSRTTLFTQSLMEWFSPDFHSSWLHGFEVLLLASIAVLALSRLRPRPFDLLLLVGLAHLALQHQRHAALFAVAAAPILARHGAPLVRVAVDAAPLPGWTARSVAAGLMVAAAVLFASAFPRHDALGKMTGRESFPVAAAEHLLRRPPGRVFNHYAWGGYLIWAWRAHPAYRVFIDGRADAYPQTVFRDYLSIERLEPEWQSLLNRYGIDVVLYPAGRPLSLMLRQTPGWERVYVDTVAEVFVRRKQLAKAALE